MTTPRIRDVEFLDLLRLEPHGPDTFVGIAARYPWGERLCTAARSWRRHCVPRRRPSTPTDRPTRCTPTSSVPVRRRSRSGTRSSGCATASRSAPARWSPVSRAARSSTSRCRSRSAEDEADVQLATFPAGLPSPDEVTLVDYGWGGLLDRRAVETARRARSSRLLDPPARRHRRRPVRSPVRAGVHVRRGTVAGGPFAAPGVRRRHQRPRPLPGGEPRPCRLVPSPDRRHRVALVRHPLPRSVRCPRPRDRRRACASTACTSPPSPRRSSCASSAMT